MPIDNPMCNVHVNTLIMLFWLWNTDLTVLVVSLMSPGCISAWLYAKMSGK